MLMAILKVVTLSARVSGELGAQVDMLANAVKRNRSWVIEEALRAYLAREMQYLSSVQAGIEAYNAGNVVSHEDVESILGLDT